MSAGEAPGTSITTVVGSSPTVGADSSVARVPPVRSQLVLILADRAESGALSRFFGQFHHGRAYEVLAAANRGEAVSAMNRERPDLTDRRGSDAVAGPRRLLTEHRRCGDLDDGVEGDPV